MKQMQPSGTFNVGDQFVLVEINRHARVGQNSLGKLVEIVRTLPNTANGNLGNVILKYVEGGEVVRGNSGQPRQWRVYPAQDKLIELGAGENSRQAVRMTPELAKQAADDTRRRELMGELAQAHVKISRLLQQLTDGDLDNELIASRLREIIICANAAEQHRASK